LTLAATSIDSWVRADSNILVGGESICLTGIYIYIISVYSLSANTAHEVTLCEYV
jgi:hypothetical protein